MKALGAFLATEEYFDNFIPLAKRYNAGGVVKFIRAPLIQNKKRIHLTDYLGRGPLSLLLVYLDALQYICIHKQLFGSYDGELMPRPSMAVLYRIRGTFLQFLQRENLLGLAPLFSLSHTFSGYGYLDEVSAFYGLLWNTPRLLTGQLIRSGDRHNVFILRKGFYNVWLALQRKEKFNIKFHTTLERISRFPYHLELQSNHGVEVCDWLVWTPPIQSLLNTLETPTYKENKLLQGQTNESFTVSLVKVKNWIEGPYNIYTDNLNLKTNHGVIGEGDYKGMTSALVQSEAGLQQYRRKNKYRVRTLRSSQLNSRKACSLTECYHVLRNHFKNTTGFDPQIIQSESYAPYFPRWTSSEVL